MPELLSVLYIRDDYVGMWIELKSIISGGIRRVVITGNPGIGKSRFALFVLHQLTVSGLCNTIVWEATQSRRRYLFRRGERALKGDLGAFVDVLDDTSAW